MAVRSSNGPDVSLTYDLPPTIKSIRDGYQTTFQSAAVVSGLLAGAAAQLYSFFKADGSYTGEAQSNTAARELIVICCYCAMFFNIGATISGFILIDGLGELQYQAATADPVLLPSGGSMAGSSLALLKRFGGGGFWGWLIVHWFFSFCFGVISLLVLLCAYVFVQESVVVKVIAVCLSVYILFPALGFIFSVHHRASGPETWQLVGKQSPPSPSPTSTSESTLATPSRYTAPSSHATANERTPPLPHASVPQNSAHGSSFAQVAIA